MKNPVYQSDNFQIQEAGIFLLGYSAHHNSSALAFLKDTVSRHDSWKVQEILTMSFDNHCKIIGYDAALPLIEEWLNSNRANVRRAVSEGLRRWTNRSYFRDNPQIAIQVLSAHREDTSEYVRKSVGNALRDISRQILITNFAATDMMAFFVLLFRSSLQAYSSASTVVGTSGEAMERAFAVTQAGNAAGLTAEGMSIFLLFATGAVFMVLACVNLSKKHK